MPPKSKLYEFDHLIAENDLSQSWVAVRRDSGEKCFIKCPSDVAGLPAESKADILRRSYQLQSRVKTPGIVTARAIHSEGGNVFVEYRNEIGNDAVSAQDRFQLSVDVNGRFRILSGSGKRNSQVRMPGFSGPIDDTAHNGNRELFNSRIPIPPIGHLFPDMRLHSIRYNLKKR